VVLFVNTVTHREGCRTVSSRRATEAYPLWYGAGSTSQDSLMYPPPQAASIKEKRESGPAKAILRWGKDNAEEAVLRHSNATVFTNRATKSKAKAKALTTEITEKKTNHKR